MHGLLFLRLLPGLVGPERIHSGHMEGQDVVLDPSHNRSLSGDRHHRLQSSQGFHEAKRSWVKIAWKQTQWRKRFKLRKKIQQIEIEEIRLRLKWEEKWRWDQCGFEDAFGLWCQHSRQHHVAWLQTMVQRIGRAGANRGQGDQTEEEEKVAPRVQGRVDDRSCRNGDQCGFVIFSTILSSDTQQQRNIQLQSNYPATF